MIATVNGRSMQGLRAILLCVGLSACSALPARHELQETLPLPAARIAQDDRSAFAAVFCSLAAAGGVGAGLPDCAQWL
ncbi:hypothetical protein [Parahaliea aestuarii]|uniref:Uncharacterized protein n=1 Tax=Parahaliea aestuarii TaxID=1852021 RepID=A0A5C8ZQL6_9GAMM|nr:hypothetical protein [Parahaliea aestuarii]TXS89621.1 hypothetical protein FVW59_16520 [Parahaliea aestuarii]